MKNIFAVNISSTNDKSRWTTLKPHDFRDKWKSIFAVDCCRADGSQKVAGTQEKEVQVLATVKLLVKTLNENSM